MGRLNTEKYTEAKNDGCSAYVLSVPGSRVCSNHKKREAVSLSFFRVRCFTASRRLRLGTSRTDMHR